MAFCICEVSLGEVSLVLDGHLVVKARGCLLGGELTHIALLAAEHHQNLPRASVLRDPAELGAAEVADHIRAIENLLNAAGKEDRLSLRYFRGGLNDDFSAVFSLEGGIQADSAPLDQGRKEIFHIFLWLWVKIGSILRWLILTISLLDQCELLIDDLTGDSDRHGGRPLDLRFLGFRNKIFLVG